MVTERDLRKLERLATELGPRDERLIRRLLAELDAMAVRTSELRNAADDNLALAAQLSGQLETSLIPSLN